MFTIDRNEGGTLCDQIAEGFRRAIAAGEYGPGDRLPQMRELAAHFGVSIRVVVRAFAKLETERLVSGRRGVGCVCQNIRAGVVCDRLSVRGYLMQRVTVPAFKRRVYDFRSLDLLLRQDTSLVVMVGSQPEIERHLAVSNVRYAVVGKASIQSAKCVGQITTDVAQALRDFAAHAAYVGGGMEDSDGRLFERSSGRDTVEDARLLPREAARRREAA